MSNEQIVRRLISLESAIPVTSLRTANWPESEWPAFMKATDTIEKLPVFVDDTPGIGPVELRAKAMQIDAMAGLDLIVVDFLQLMRAGGRHESRYMEVTAISQALKALAMDMNLPVLALSQLSRACEQRGDKRPVLSDLRESGDIEQTANAVIFIYRDEMYNKNTERPNIADIIVAKNRDGPIGTADLYFRKELAQFLDAEVRRQAIEDDHYSHYANRL